MVIATRSRLVEAGLMTLLPEVPQVKHIASASDGPGTVDLLLRLRPDVLLLDHELASDVHDYAAANGVDFTEYSPRVLLLSSRHHVGTQSACGEHCACGFVREQSPLRHIRSAMRIIGGCGASRLGDGYCSSCPLRQSVRLPKLPLSDREYQIFDRIGCGHGSQQISRELKLSVKTVETHRESIKRKIGVSSAAALRETAMAWRRGDYLLKPAPGAKGRPRRAVGVGRPAGQTERIPV
ncbi:hypothetical protein N800_11125 [Lysobacter daejeonensis GH1-9]|uniref:HTH luxR-type domain-containing protein n=2 Tax=Aerolutibacter TaxID=3382701 RepID=A0A0A0ESG7_9GAMM|nr:hypothetical protein N800_11125 [Lysobacter daejeonensis GH1-9]